MPDWPSQSPLRKKYKRRHMLCACIVLKRIHGVTACIFFIIIRSVAIAADFFLFSGGTIFWGFGVELFGGLC
jgi:hypothetical protein